jgi:hypothetical protein
VAQKGAKRKSADKTHADQHRHDTAISCRFGEKLHNCIPQR